MKRTLSLLLIAAALMSILSGCADQKNTSDASVTEQTASKVENRLPDGIYLAEFDTDSSMFHVNEAKEGKGILTVCNGEMTIHITLVSKNIVNLYPGKVADITEDAQLLMPTVDTVTYSDGYVEDVYGFDVPVPALDEEFDLALIGSKQKWYDHKVSVSAPVLIENQQ